MSNVETETEFDPRKVEASEKAAQEWAALSAAVTRLEAQVTMSEEEEGLAELFEGVLPALRLHRDHGLTDCLSCGGTVTMPALVERIELAESYAASGLISRRARGHLASARDKANAEEQKALRLMEAAATPLPPRPPIPTDEELLAQRWTKEQIGRMTKNAKRYILRHGGRPEYFSILVDGSLYELRDGRGKAIIQSLDGVFWT